MRGFIALNTEVASSILLISIKIIDKYTQMF